ncbi:MAG: preprotein translocase subunit SecA [Candidatus Calescibacterium sp.]|nr:preprotein translocase subunit SecA [Candidatus Calescibacterium sp.]MDW8132722.1 preprotein translocase subunit SecA [Candidatus Calescibacterium sp.]
MKILKKIFRFFDPNEWEIKKIRKILTKINELEKDISKLSDDDLKAKTFDFKERINKGQSLDDILPEAFAVVREASKRVLSMRHFDVQIIGGIVLHQGRIAEMKTGEGKTLVATLPAYLNALTGKGVHIVTVNDYLAKRDAEWMGPIYRFLGLSVGYIQQLMDKNVRKEMYSYDITYVTNYEVGFDYLRDNLVYRLEDRVLRGLNFAIIDEVDSILIDEARTPLIISGPTDDKPELFEKFAKLAELMENGKHYTVEEKSHAISLTDEGIEFLEKKLNIDDLYSNENWIYAFHINAALKAKEFFKRDREYIVEDGEIIIIDEFTGRKMYGRRFSGGIHQAIEAKEGIRVKHDNRTLATITYQNFFRMYEKLAGMTGTAATEEEEFKQIYNMDVVVIPTYKPTKRKDHPDKIFQNENAKFEALVDFVEDLYKKGRPVLIGTRNIIKNEIISRMLSERKIPHNVLNAKNHEREAEIIAQAGKLSAVTVATNMAGRGVDIILGGKPLSNDELCNLPDCKVEFKHTPEYHKVVDLGGLFVIGTERHESRRIDNQLRGRAGRLGDNGDTVFFISIEDELFKIFGGETFINFAKNLFSSLGEKENISSSLLAKQLDGIQRKIETTHFQIRKTLLAYDDVVNRQREVFYKERDRVIKKEEIFDLLSSTVSEVLERNLNFILSFQESIYNRDFIISKVRDFWNNFNLDKNLLQKIVTIFADKIPESLTSEALQKVFDDIDNTIVSVMIFELKSRIQFGNIPDDVVLEVLKNVILEIMDKHWIEHLHNIEYLREGIKLRGWGNIDPLTAFRSESNELFGEMITNIHDDIVRTVFNLMIVVRYS